MGLAERYIAEKRVAAPALAEQYLARQEEPERPGYFERVRQERERLSREEPGKSDIELLTGKPYEQLAEENPFTAATVGHARQGLAGGILKRLPGRVPEERRAEIMEAERKADESLSTPASAASRLLGFAPEIGTMAAGTALMAPAVGSTLGGAMYAGAGTLGAATALQGGRPEDVQKSAALGAAIPLAGTGISGALPKAIVPQALGQAGLGASVAALTGGDWREMRIMALMFGGPTAAGLMAARGKDLTSYRGVAEKGLEEYGRLQRQTEPSSEAQRGPLALERRPSRMEGPVGDESFVRVPARPRTLLREGPPPEIRTWRAPKGETMAEEVKPPPEAPQGRPLPSVFPEARGRVSTPEKPIEIEGKPVAGVLEAEAPRLSIQPGDEVTSRKAPDRVWTVRSIHGEWATLEGTGGQKSRRKLTTLETRPIYEARKRAEYEAMAGGTRGQQQGYAGRQARREGIGDPNSLLKFLYPEKPGMSDLVQEQNMAESLGEMKSAKETGSIFLGRSSETLEDIVSPNRQVEEALTSVPRPKSFRQTLTGKFSRAFVFAPALRRNPELMQMREWTRQSVDFKRRAHKKAERRTVGIVGVVGRDHRAFEIARRFITMKDLEHTAETGRVVPNGMELPQIKQELARLAPLVEKDGRVRGMVARYTRMMQAIAQDKIAAGAPPDIINNKYYFPHEILDYISFTPQGRKLAGGRRSVGTEYEPHMRKRQGSPRLMNNEFLDVITQYFERHELNRMKVDFLNKVRMFDKPEQFAQPFDPKHPEMEYVKWIDKTGFWSKRPLTIPESILERIQAGIATDPEIARGIGLKPEQFQRLLEGDLTFGQMTIPRGVAETLDNMAAVMTPKWETGLVAEGNRIFKSGALFLRTIPFFKNNFLGDTEGLAIYDPGALNPARPSFRRAFEDAINAEFFNKESPDFQLAVEKSVADSGWVGKEVRRDIKRIPEFRRLTRGEMTTKEAKHILGKTWDYMSLQGAHQARENFPRLAKFYADLERHRAGKPMVTGPLDIRGFTDPIDAAAYLSRETLGDYGKFTPTEQVLRNSLLIPFYSFFHNNTQRYARSLAAPKYMGRAGVTASLRTLRVLGLIYGSIYAWNNSGERKKHEDRLTGYKKTTTHLILGEDEEGKPIIDSAQTTVDDIFRTFGLDHVSPDAWMAIHGHKKWIDVLKKWADEGAVGAMPGVGHLYDAVIERGGPAIKEPMVLVGRDPFPNPREARSIPQEETGKYLLKNFGLAVPVNFYEAATGKSGKSVGEVATETFSPTGRTHVDVDRENYFNLANKIRNFNKKKGYTDPQGGETPTSKPRRAYFMALSGGNKEAADQAIKDWKQAARESKTNFGKSFSGAIKGKHPRRMLGKHYLEWRRQAPPDEKAQFDKAVDYWRRVYLRKELIR